MQCPYCSNRETKVIDKRDHDGMTKRRRECLKCKQRFNTHEEVENILIRVIKKDGKREDFDEEKVRRGILRACEKRPVSTEQINKMIKNIEEKVRRLGRDVHSNTIGEAVSKELKRTDKVAYIRFASVYREFEDVSDFKKEIKELSK